MIPSLLALLMVLTTYIVRFYGFVKNRPHRLVGVVEEVGVKGRKAFTNYDELWDILNPPKAFKSGSSVYLSRFVEREGLPRTRRGAGVRGKSFTGKRPLTRKGGDH